MRNLVILFLFPFVFHAQNTETFKIGLGTDFRKFKMEELNSQLNDENYIQSDIVEDVLISDGVNHKLTISYQPCRFFNLGIYAAYQFGSAKRKIVISEDSQGYPIVPIIGTTYYDVKAISVGIYTELLLNNLSIWPNYSFLSKIEANFTLQTGFVKNLFFVYSKYNNTLTNPYKARFTSEGIQLISLLKLGYILTDNNYFSSIGGAFGYQFFRVSDLKNHSDGSYPQDKDTKLDFSGLSLGVYITIGR